MLFRDGNNKTGISLYQHLVSARTFSVISTVGKRLNLLHFPFFKTHFFGNIFRAGLFISGVLQILNYLFVSQNLSLFCQIYFFKRCKQTIITNFSQIHPYRVGAHGLIKFYL
ncbi:MAG: hypothetical protein ACD_25C00258G0001 [uncultured bacterium]|nr:MAG: hypothetical protein ACD_25C00258G0001 [uncultured bacterium]